MIRLLFVFLLTSLCLWIFRAEGKLTCQEFTTDKEIRDLINAGHKRAQSCPCIEQIIKTDYTFGKKKNCYKQWLFIDDVKQICCYSENGNLILDSPGAGYLLLESKEEYIEEAHDICCGNGSITYEQTCKLFYQIDPPDDCSSYVPPTSALSSGDPVIQTIDGEHYDFNGHGEYEFLTDYKDFKIQARTEYVMKGNNDSTFMSAFALKTSNEQIELHYDKNKNDIRFFRNGKINDNCSASSHKGPFPCEQSHNYDCFVLAGGKKVVIQRCGFQSYISQLVFSMDNFLTVKIIRNPGIDTTNITGLAGHQENGSYIMRNSSYVSVNASELQLFEFAETWSLQNESESIFRYNETGGNYTIYNNHHTRPEFLEDKLGNLSALFKDFSQENITRFNQTCRNYWDEKLNNQCLLTIARTGYYSLGLAVMKEANTTRRKWEILHNKAPTVSSEFPLNITVNYNSTWTINLTKFITDDNTDKNLLVFTVKTNLTTEDYSLDNAGMFKWHVGTELRFIATGMTFVVYDKYNASVILEPIIYYCGCINSSFCLNDTSNSYSSDIVKKAGCQCPRYAEGLYCEKPIHNCQNYSCYNDDCNAIAYRYETTWPCAPCPRGRQNTMSGFNQTCEDIDECKSDYTGEDKCEQNCTNIIGTFKCNCSRGYELNSDDHSCDDIDECTRGIQECKETEICVNTVGSALCQCAPGYYRDSDGFCKEIVGGSYVGTIGFKMIVGNKLEISKTTTYDNETYRKIIEKNLTSAFNGSEFIKVDVVSLSLIKNQNDSTLRATFIVHMENRTKDGTDIKRLLDKSLSGNEIDGKRVDLNKNVYIIFNITSLDIISMGLCTIPKRVECDLSTTNCEDLGGYTRCLCKRGFEAVPNSNIFCKDINECIVNKKDMNTDLCVRGQCDNTVGSWVCNCDDSVYTHPHNTSYGHKTRYRCEGDFQYIGQLEIYMAEEMNNDTLIELINNTIAQLFSQRDIQKWNDHNPSMPDLVWKTDILSITTGTRHMYIIKYLVHIGESISTTLVRQYQEDIIIKSKQRILKETGISIDKATILDESGFNLCNISGKTECDPDTTLCKVHNGSYSCLCKGGYSREFHDQYHCQDINECKWHNMTTLCKHGECINTEGSWDCFCKNESYPDYFKFDLESGLKKIRCEGRYQYIGKVSLDQDYSVNNTQFQAELSKLFKEASTVNVNCLDDTTMFSDIFKKVDVIKVTYGANGTGTVMYVLHLGESVSTTCLSDIQYTYFEGSILSSSFVNATILNEDGFSICDVEGLTLCDTETTNCEAKNGAYTCPCKHGFKPEILNPNPHQCEDINECQNQSCYNGGTCINTFGNWTCTCLPGYEPVRYGRNNITCKDIDECERPDIYTCDGKDNSTECINTVGDWNCSCKDGFKARYITYNARICEDIDECSSYQYKCEGGKCKNTVGNWSCECDEGYSNSTTKDEGKHVICKDIDECKVNETPCLNAIGCDNLNGTWQCRCTEGLEETKINKTSKQCKGEYLYVASMSFSLTGKITDVEQLHKDIQNKILDIYKSEFQNVWIEILSINGLSSDTRKKRSVPIHHITADYIVHLPEEKTQKQLNTVATTYKDHYCNNITCDDKIGGYHMILNEINSKNESAICDTKQNVCNEETSTCNSTNGKLQCLCKEGYVKIGDESSLLCRDIDECKQVSNLHCEIGRECVNERGSWDCLCENGFKAIRTNDTFKECKDPCLSHRCHKTSICEKAETDSGYKCQCKKGRKGELCNEIDHEYTDSKKQTMMIAISSSLGGSLLILLIVIFVVCRWRAGKVKEAEQISMKQRDKNGFKSFDGSFPTNQYLQDRDDDARSFYSQRLSCSSLPYGQQNGVSGSGRYSGNPNEPFTYGLYSMPNKLPRPNFHGSMPNLANGGTNFNSYDDRRYSGEGPKRMISYDQGLNRSFDFDRRLPRNNWNGRRSPSPDYGIPKSPKADYGRPKSPKPDYHQARKLYRSKDSVVGNGNSSESYEYQRPEKRRDYYYGQRQSTNF